MFDFDKILNDIVKNVNLEKIKEEGERFMDPLTGLISIISLVSIFKQERNQKRQGFDEFKEWLEEHNFDQIINNINENKLQKQISDVLMANQEDILTGIEAINSKLDKFVATTVFQPFSTLDNLSEQSNMIVDKFYSDDYHTMIPMPGSEYRLYLSKAPCGADELEVDHLYIDSDLRDLVSKDFLLLDYNDSGNPIYKKTSDGNKYYKSNCQI